MTRELWEKLDLKYVLLRNGNVNVSVHIQCSYELYQNKKYRKKKSGYYFKILQKEKNEVVACNNVTKQLIKYEQMC